MIDAAFEQKANSLEDIDLLRYYADEWSRYTRGAKYLNRLFTFLNRHWVERERSEGKKSVYPVYTVSSARRRNAVLMMAISCFKVGVGPVEDTFLHAHPEG